MNKKQSCLLFAAALILLGSCNQEDSLLSIKNGNALKINASVALPTTRAFDNKWNPNDEIGVYLVKAGTKELVAETNANVEYRSDNTDIAESCNFNAVSDGIHLPADGSMADVISYYPYSANQTANGVRTLDLTEQTEQAPIDLLAAKAEGLNAENTMAALTFNHKLTKVFLNIKATDGISTEGISARIGNQYTNVKYDILSDRLMLTEGAEKKTITMRQYDTYCEAIILPNTVDGNAIADRTLDFTLGGVEYDATISAATSFEPGKKYVYNVTFSSKGVTVQGAGITNWVDQPGEDIAPATTTIKNVYLFGDPTEWSSRIQLTDASNGIFTYSGNLYVNQDFKFTLADNGDFNTYQLMPEPSGTNNKDLTEGVSNFSKVLYNNGNDNKWHTAVNGFYTITLNTKTMKMTVTHKDIDLTSLYIVGDAAPNGWPMDKADSFEKQDDGTYTLKVTLQAGNFKLPLWRDHGFECDYLMPSNATNHVAAFATNTAMPLHRANYPDCANNDDQWKVSADQAGTYTLTVNLTNNTLTAVKD